MARAHFSDAAIDRQGNAIPQAQIDVFIRGTDIRASIYGTEGVPVPMENPHIVEDGIISFWADAGAYDVTITDLGSPPRVDPRTVGWGAVPGVDRGIPGRMLAVGAVGEAELGDLSVGSGKIKGNAVQAGHLQDGAVTDAKVTSVGTNKLTGQITAAQVAADVATQAELDAVSGVASAKASPGFVIAMS